MPQTSLLDYLHINRKLKTVWNAIIIIMWHIFFDALTSPKNMSYYSPNRSFFHGPDNISHVISCSRQPTQRSKFQHRFVNLPGRIGKWARTIWKYQPYPTHILIRFLCNHEFTKEKKQHKSWSGEYTDAILTRLSAEMSTSGHCLA